MIHDPIGKWHHLRVKGDRAKALKYLSKARDFLRKLGEQLDRSGALSGARSVDYEPGVKISVFWAMGIPSIEIEVTGEAQTPPVATEYIDGFVVCPSPNTVSPPSQYIVLQPDPGKGTDDWVSYFYDATTEPSSPSFRLNIYKTDHIGRPLFEDGTLNEDSITHLPIPPHQDGLQNFGNVDWRNQDESLIVTWVGPAGRYLFTTSAAGANLPLVGPYVFVHGQQLFDCSVLASGGFFGSLTDYATDYAGRTGTITGACIASDPSGNLALFCFVRLGTQNVTALTTNRRRTEYLLRLQIESADTRGYAIPTASIFKLSAPVSPSTYDGSPVILWTQELSETSNEDNDDLHPWFFNQSGTQARCVRTDSTFLTTRYIHEKIVTIDPHTGDGSLVTNDSSFSTYTDTTVTDNYHTIADGSIPYGDGVETIYPDGNSVPFGHEDCWQGYSTETIITENKTESSPDQLAFVDFRDDVVVYGYWKTPTLSRTDTATIPTLTGSSTVTLGSSLTVGSTTVTDETITQSFDVSHTANATSTGITNGIKTDWGEFLAESTFVQTHSASASSSQTTTITYTNVSGTIHETDTISGSSTGEGTITETTVDRTFNLIYLDLRYKWVSYSIDYTTTVLTSTLALTTVAISDTQSGTYGSVPVLTTWSSTSLSPVKTVREDIDYYITLDGVELAHTSVNMQATTTTTGSGTGLPTTFSFFTDARTWQSWATFTFFFSGGDTPSTVPLAVPADTSGGGCSMGDISPVTTTSTGNGSATVGAGVDHRSVYALISVTVGNVDAPATIQMFGSMQTYKGSWCLSQAMPDGVVTTQNYVFKNAGGMDMKVYTNDTSATYMHPIWVLPKVTY